MRIAYVTPYQGPALLQRRPVLSSLGLAANLKIELVAELLRKMQHDVEVLSPGEVADANRTKRYYAGFREPAPFSPEIPVYYASAMPVRRVNALWSTLTTLQLLRRRHRWKPFDLAIVYNLQLPQTMATLYTQRFLRLPVVLEYEDDALVDIAGHSEEGRRGSWQLPFVRRALGSVSACVGVSPHLLARIDRPVPKMLLRGVVSDEVREMGRAETARQNWVVFSGTHSVAKGLGPLVEAWKTLRPEGWELHIAGHGEKTDALKKRAEGDRTIVFHGLLNRRENAELLGMSKIGINPHDVSATPGNVFAFKIIEYLAAGTHVITTPMGPLESDLEAGITYMADNTPETIAQTLSRVIDARKFTRHATDAAQRRYGRSIVARSLDALISEVCGLSIPSSVEGQLSRSRS